MNAHTPTQGEIGLVLGRDTRATLQLLIAAAALHGPVRVVDAGRWFNLLGVTRALLRLSDGDHRRLHAALARVRVARVSTAHHAVALLIAPAQPGETWVLVDWLRPFEEDGLDSAEALRLLQVGIRQMERLRVVGPVVVGAAPPAQPDRQALLATLCGAADRLFVES